MAARSKRSDSAKAPVTPAQAKRNAASAIRRAQRADTQGMRERSVRQDRWVNPSTGMGTWDDKTRHGFFDSPFRLMDTEITALANGNDLAAKLIEKRPDEMFRRGYELEPVKTGKASDNDVKASDLKELIEYANEELEFDARFKQGIKYGRQYGGSLLVLAIDDGRMPWQPVDEDNIRSIQAINQIDRRFAYVQSYYSDYQRPKYGQAKTYLIANGVATSAERDDEDEFFMKKRSPSTLRNNGYSILNVHESRVVRFSGVETDVITRQQLAGWSWSVLQRPYEALRQTDSSFDSLCYLISDASQAVMKLKGLFRAIESGQKGKLEERMRMLEKTRSVMRGIALDAGGEEDFTRVQTPLTGIPESIDRMMQRCAAAFDMPLTELFGMSPAGMNATGESDRIKWYDTIASDQMNFLSPVQIRVLRLIMLAKRGPMKGRVVPIKIHYRPLYAPTEDEVSKTRLQNAQRDQIYTEMGGPVTADVVALGLTDVYPALKPEDIEAEIDAKTAFDPHENDPIKSAGAQALAENHPAVQGDPKAGGGVKVEVPKPPPPKPGELAPAVKAVGGARGTGGEGAGGAGEAQSPTVPLPGSSLHGGAVAPAGEGTGTPSDQQRKPANQRAAKKDKVDPGPNVAKDAYKQLLKDFPASSIGWVLATDMQGPKEVDLSRIDFSTRDTWRATRDPDKVARFAEKVEELAPVILVDRRGSDLLDPVDGHHRILAYETRGLPVVAYVFSVQCKEGPWTDLHTMIQKGNSGGGATTSRQAARGPQSREGTNLGSRTDAGEKEPEAWLAETVARAVADALEKHAGTLPTDDRADFDPDQPRDEQGRFGSGGGHSLATAHAHVSSSHLRHALHSVVSALRAAPGALGRVALHEVKEKIHEAKTAVQGVGHFLSGKPVSKEEKHAIAKVAVSVAAALIAGHLTPLVAGFAHLGEGVAGRVVEKIADQVAHHVIEHFANTGLKLDTLDPVMRYDAAGNLVDTRLDDFTPERDEQGRFAPSGGGATRPPGHPESADLRGWADPDPNLTIADRASRNAEGRTAIAKTAEDHAKAFEAHAIAGRLHEFSGNAAKAEAHKAKAQAHKSEAQRMTEALSAGKPFFNPELEGWTEQDKKDGSPDQPRDERGRFGSGGDVARTLVEKALKNGGFSYRPGEPKPTKGYMVSLPTSAGANHVIDVKELGSRATLSRAAMKTELTSRMRTWLDKATPVVTSNDEHFLGGWMQKDDKGRPVALHLDISQRHDDRDKAIAQGRERNQLAVWDIEKGEEISTGGTGT